MNAEVLRDLARAKVAFQLRAIEAVIQAPPVATDRIPELLAKSAEHDARAIEAVEGMSNG